MIPNVKQIDGGADYACAVTIDGRVVCFGDLSSTGPGPNGAVNTTEITF